jgi:hypothetical protein
MRTADAQLFNRISKARDTLKRLEADLVAHGDRPLAKAVKRAYRELEHSSVSGAENTRGVDRAVRS